MTEQSTKHMPTSVIAISADDNVSTQTQNIHTDSDCFITNTSNSDSSVHPAKFTEIKSSSKHSATSDSHNFSKQIATNSNAGKQTSILNFFSLYKPNMSTSKATAIPNSNYEPSNFHSLFTKSRPINASTSTSTKFSAVLPSKKETVKRVPREKNKRTCPFYKWITDTPITVDAFSYGTIPNCHAYILTHFHYDHYQGLGKTFAHPIYCSKVTGNLVKSRLKVADRYINCLPLNETVTVENVRVTLLEANHCPGSVMLLFQLPNGKTHLHTGDFRAHPSMEAYPQLQKGGIDTLYLDTTYCDPQYTFPPQEDILSQVVAKVLDTLEAHPDTLIVCGTYTIGKERVFIAIAEAIGCKIAVTKDKLSILECLEDEQLTAKLTTDTHSTCLHVITMKSLNYTGLSEHLKRHKPRYSNLIAFEPTGWTFGGGKTTGGMRAKVNRGGITIYGVPYSEHSSYAELRRFVRFTQPRHIIPTVNNGSKESRDKMAAEFAQWRAGDGNQ